MLERPPNSLKNEMQNETLAFKDKNRIKSTRGIPLGRSMGMKAIALLGLIIVLLAINVTALAEDPPSDLDETLETIVTNGTTVSYTNLGWSSIYQLPQSHFSVDTTDFYDNAIEFSGVGFFALGLKQLQNPLLSELDLNQTMQTQINQLAAQTLPFVWTPASTNWGTHHKEKLPNQVTANVLEQVQGIFGPSNVCHALTVPFNAWGFPESTTNALSTSDLDSISSMGTTFLLAAEDNNPNKEKYLTTAKYMGDLLLGVLVTPETESFGIHPSQVIDDNNKTLPTGMMPRDLTIKTDSPDTPACTDGGTIKIHENEKTQMATTALFLQQLFVATGDAKYQRAKNYIIEGILALQECDGLYRNYTRWEGAGVRENTCTPEGTDAYSAYPSNITVADSQGLVLDSATILYLLQQTNPNIYNDNSRYRTAVKAMLELEEKDTGNGYRKNGSALRYASYSLPEKTESFARILLSNIFLNAACRESDSAIEKRFESKAYYLIDATDGLIQTDIDSKINKAISPDVGTHMMAVAAAANSWKIITKGCQDCTDGDGDGYIDGVCAGDTKKYDCSDTDKDIFPGATEVCDGADNDCDGKVDDGFDSDNDGVSICKNDCNDEDNQIYPGAKELLDEKDNDCNLKADDTGIQVKVLDDANAGIPNIDVQFVSFGNACVNSFAQKVENIPSIMAQCKIESHCTTDENGTCLGFFKTDGKYQSIAGVGLEALFSESITFKVGQRVDVNIITLSGISANDLNNAANGGDDNNNAGNNGGQTDYLFMGLVVIVLVIGGIGVALFYRTGKMPNFTLKWGQAKATTTKSTPTPSKSSATAPKKVEATAELKKEMPVSTPTKTVKENPKPKWKGNDKTMPKESQ